VIVIVDRAGNNPRGFGRLDGGRPPPPPPPPDPPQVQAITFTAGTAQATVAWPDSPGALCRDIGHGGLGRPEFQIDFSPALLNAGTINGSSVRLEDLDSGLDVTCARSLSGSSVVLVRPSANILTGGGALIGPLRLHITGGLRDTNGQGAVPASWDVDLVGCA
jgi:hypothetical protein